MLLVAVATPVLANEIREVSIGVLAFRGEEHAMKRWLPAADYLNEEIPGFDFEIRPLSAEEISSAVSHNELDFVLTNPGHYVELEADYGVTRIVTLKNLRAGDPYTKFGAVIFTRADRIDIQTLLDLKGKSFMAVGKKAFGGFRMAWRELEDAGISPFSDISLLKFNGFPQDDIVYAVRDGRIDAGTVRTDLLERMALQKKINLDEFKILSPKHTNGFPFAHSTRLYPEWPLARTNRTSDTLAEEVAVVLMTMLPSHRAALHGNYAGWTVPLDYTTVHDLYKKLGVGPYEHGLDLNELVDDYGIWTLIIILFVISVVGIYSYISSLNSKLMFTSKNLSKESLDRKQMQTELLKLSGALEQTADTVIITTSDGTIEYVNPAFENITGYSAGEVVGRKPDFLRSGEHKDDFYKTMWNTILDGDVFHGLFLNRRKDGKLVHEEKTITPMKNAKGEIDHFIATGKDVTEKRMIEQNSRQNQDHLAHVSRVSMMGEMASSIAHELNQPLAAITNYAQGCVRRLSSTDFKVGQIVAALENISQQSKRSGEIIKRLRSFVSKGEPKRARADINQIVQNAASLAYFEARKKGVILRLNLGKHLQPVHADVIQIEQVILNLVRNAIDAMAKNLWNKRELRIHTWSHGINQVEVAVWDTGHGLLPEDQERLFNAFFTTKEHGMGMGLSISRSIIEAHGGSLSATNNKDQGATFRFTLPIMRDEDKNDVKYGRAS